MYPATIPDSRWLYICQVYSTNRTPNLLVLGYTGVINNDASMRIIEIELNGVMQNGNPVMQAFYSWVRSYREILASDESFD